MNSLDALRDLLGADAVLTGEAMAPYLLDQRKRYRGSALAVVQPASTDEVAALLRWCSQTRTPVVPQGGNTSLCGAATPDGSATAVVVSLARMNRVLEVDAGNNTITVEAGCTLADARAAAHKAGRLLAAHWAVDSKVRLGGALGTNAGGLNVLHYGNTRELTLGLEVVLPDGEVLGALRGLRKDSSGYDLKQLFIGSEGTLGIITRAVLRLDSLPTAIATALVPIADAQAAIALLRELQHTAGDRVTSFELISRRCWELIAEHCPELPAPFAALPPWCVLLELSDAGTAEALRARLGDALTTLGLRDGARLAANEEERGAYWAWREAIPEAQKRRGVSIKHDIAVPISSIPAFLVEAEAALKALYADADIVAFGHVGDGNLHYNLFRDDVSDAAYDVEPQVNAAVYAVVMRYDGTISAEHGIGQLKRDLLPQFRSAAEMTLMRAIKQSLDPLGIMNPGKVL
ncbi:FAD/FMN-containing dehydrogenase [Andreprevotia lacus DSM 23236]|jgi:FAD/FMN-containing dehydrogenase|uniref:FAD/FMN-containing dehydrogenase n=1 Tax=Andreprevotia lacus DSM 23236 TaxID=1121001 RepID=A0A1W1XC92_9NEIS|nr:FAD-binding oxidoreductase [Andreprevotia lacus]SMC21470.1 FAD/FMN-containing dehydrogenase [Andreprevotia lacus DSM 23236]